MPFPQARMSVLRYGLWAGCPCYEWVFWTISHRVEMFVWRSKRCKGGLVPPSPEASGEGGVGLIGVQSPSSLSGGTPTFSSGFSPHPQPLSHAVGEGSRTPSLSRSVGRGRAGEGEGFVRLRDRGLRPEKDARALEVELKPCTPVRRGRVGEGFRASFQSLSLLW